MTTTLQQSEWEAEYSFLRISEYPIMSPYHLNDRTHPGQHGPHKSPQHNLTVHQRDSRDATDGLALPVPKPPPQGPPPVLKQLVQSSS